MIEVGGRDNHRRLELFQSGDLQIRLQEVDQFLEVEEARAWHHEFGEITYGESLKKLQYPMRLIAIGKECPCQSASTHARKDVGLDIVLQQCLNGSQMGKTLDESAAQGEANRVFDTAMWNLFFHIRVRFRHEISEKLCNK